MKQGEIAAAMTISLVLGLAAGGIADARAGTFLKDSEPVENENCTSCAGPHKPDYGAGWIQVKTEGPLYVMNKPDASGWADAWGIPPFWVDINSKGLRDSSFSVEKPRDTVRVLVLGTSTTFGYGVNETDTFPELVEKRLNSEFDDKRIQVLNAGSPGYGIEDYYDYMVQKGFSFNPDIIVLASKSNDWLSRKEINSIHLKARERIGQKNSQKIPRRRLKKIARRIIQERYRHTPIAETGFGLLYNISQLSRQKDINLVYYSAGKLKAREKRYVKEWSRKEKIPFIRAPVRYRNVVEPPVRISEWDSHPSELGHRLLAEGLYPVLEKKVAATID